jgi:hypothetical protein
MSQWHHARFAPLSLQQYLCAVAIKGQSPYKNHAKQDRYMSLLSYSVISTLTIVQVRGHAFGLISRPGSGSQQPSSIANVMGSQHSLSDTRPGSPLRLNTDVSDALSANQHELSVEASAGDSKSVLSPTRRCKSPISRVRCDGWCGYDLIPRATVVCRFSCVAWM